MKYSEGIMTMRKIDKPYKLVLEWKTGDKSEFKYPTERTAKQAEEMYYAIHGEEIERSHIEKR